MQVSYKLTFECEDNGVRRFEAESSNQTQHGLAKSLACDIARMLEATLNMPPSALQVAGAIEHGMRGVVTALSYASEEAWTAESNFDDCIELIIDIDKLMDGAEQDRIDLVRRVLLIFPCVTLK